MPRTQIERIWLVGATLVGLIMTVLAYLVFIGPQRSETTQVQGQVESANTKNTTLHTRIAELTAQNKTLATFQAKLQQAQLALPSTSGLPDFLRTLQSIGNATSTDLTTLTVGAPTDLSATTVTAKTAGTGAPSSSGHAAASSASKVYALPITAQITGNDAQLNDFLTQLQSVQPRAVLISQITEGAVSTTGTTVKGKVSDTLELTMQAFVAPSSPIEADQLAKAAAK